ncbi:hypothetical protein ACQ33O_09415 [Ferruginibacter sp. SUN002]|uniref:hypothetical protein n=1 Tax=Ferruginibacter sp. SUN002 TaxID=2937789 RepID=UPI003D36A137
MTLITKQVYSEPMHDYLAYASAMRGTLINAVAEMERDIDDYICGYFCRSSKKRTELMEVILANSHVGFRAKVEILRYVLKKKKQAKPEQIAYFCDTVLKKKIADKRNMMAHNPLDTSKASVNKFLRDKSTIHVIQYANMKKVKPYTKKETADLLMLIHSVTQFFRNLKIKKR